MIKGRSLVGVLLPLTFVLAAHAQRVVVNDPTVESKPAKLTQAENALFEKQALPKVRPTISPDQCTESVEIAGVVRGAFSKPGARQSLIFYQYCQTGNGFGVVGLVLIEGDAVVGNFTADAGWSIDISKVDDIDRNGLSEFALSYSGGLHQGQGGVGVDLMQFRGGKPVGIGWYLAERFDESDDVTAWKLTARSGASPVFYSQRFAEKGRGKWKSLGPPKAIKLKKITPEFEEVK